MFKELYPLLQKTELTLKLSPGPEGRIKVVVIPMTMNDKEPSLSKPLMVSATPDELDAGFGEAMAQFRTSRTSLEDQVRATTEALADAKKVQANKATSAKAKLKAPSTSDDLPVDEDEESTAPSTSSSASPAVVEEESGTDLSKLLD